MALKLNEAVDDIGAEEDDELMGTDEALPETDRTGQFKRTIAGRAIWFRMYAPGQRTALMRFRSSLIDRFEKVRASKKLTDEQRYVQITEIYETLDLKSLTFIESLVVDEDDLDFLVDKQLTGEVTVASLLNAVFGQDEAPDDDEDPKPVKSAPRPNPMKKAVQAKKTVAAKKTANAKRTTR